MLQTTRLIEIKDYRKSKEGRINLLPDRIRQQIRDTQAGLAAASKFCHEDNDIGDIATVALEQKEWRVVLHIEGLKKIEGDLPGNIHLKVHKWLSIIDKITS